MIDRALLMKLIYVCCCTIFIFWTSSAVAAHTDEWRFTVGYSYLSHVKEIKDSYKHLLKDRKNKDDIYNTSISISFQPYYQFHSGLRSGAGIGPLILLLGDARHVQIPLNLTLGYTFGPLSDYSAHVRTGISYHLASGDYYSASIPGLYAAIGVEMFHSKRARLGIETAYDGAEIKLDLASDRASHEKIKTGEITVYVYADF